MATLVSKENVIIDSEAKKQITEISSDLAETLLELEKIERGEIKLEGYSNREDLKKALLDE